MVTLRYTTNGLTFRRAFHDDSWKVKLRTLLEAGVEVFVEEKASLPSPLQRWQAHKSPPDASGTSMRGAEPSGRVASAPALSVPRVRPRL
jgi:hypothetical protein